MKNSRVQNRAKNSNLAIIYYKCNLKHMLGYLRDRIHIGKQEGFVSLLCMANINVTNTQFFQYYCRIIKSLITTYFYFKYYFKTTKTLDNYQIT